MNERIKQLAEQAGISLSQKDFSYYWVESTEDIEKFAELIVRECMEVCKSRVGNRDYNTGRMHCVSDLKEHFGVEE